MTVTQAIAYLDETTPNRYSPEQKRLWLQTVETAAAAVLGVEPPADGEELLLGQGYDAAYLRYMEAQIRYHDGMESASRHAMEAYEKTMAAFARAHQRENLPERGGKFL